RAYGVGSASSGGELVLGSGDFRLRRTASASVCAALPTHVPASLGAEARGFGLAEGRTEPVFERLGLAGGPAPSRCLLPRRGRASTGFHRSRRRLPGDVLPPRPQTPARDRGAQARTHLEGPALRGHALAGPS